MAREGFFVVAVVAASIAFAAPAVASGDGQLSDGYAPGQVIVGFDRDLSRAQRTEAIRGEDASRLDKLPLAGVELVQVESDASVAEAVDEFEQRGDVRYAQPDYVVEPATFPDDPQIPQQWALHNAGQTVNFVAGAPDADIDAPEAWDLTTGSRSVQVAVIDTGIALDHPDLAANIWTNPGEVAANGVDDDSNGFVDDIRGWDFVQDDNNPYDLNGHGTHSAGNVGAVGNNGTLISGVAQQVTLMPVRIGGVQGSGLSSDILEGMSYAGRNGAAIANVSFGISGQAFQDVYNQNPNTLYTVSAGNDGADVDGTALACNTPAPNVVCVAASTQSDGLAGFSNFGATSVELAAPGVNNLSTFARTTIFTDSFNDFTPPCTLSGWTVDAGSWGCEDPPPTSSDPNDPALSDSLGGNYGTGDPAVFAVSPSVNLSGQQLCALNFELELHMTADTNDALRIQESANPGTVGGTTLQSLTGSTGGDFDNFGFELAGEGDSTYFIRFARDGDGDAFVDDGAYIDNVAVSCGALNTRFSQGTSFSAPIVAGVAALALAIEPAATATDLRNALLAGVDQKPAFAGKVETGGRVNALRTIQLANIPPETQIDSGPAEGSVVAPDPTFSLSSEPGATFQCSLDGANYIPCASPFTASGLDDGSHTLLVRAVDGIGATDLSPATRNFSISSQSCRRLTPTIFPAGRTIRGTSGPDVIIAARQTTKILAGAGNDVVCGRNKGETSNGGPGNDIIVAKGGNDRLAGGGGRDLLLGGVGRDVLLGGAARDRCKDGPGSGTETSCEA